MTAKETTYETEEGMATYLPTNFKNAWSRVVTVLIFKSLAQLGIVTGWANP